jgi:hypothetical protein
MNQNYNEQVLQGSYDKLTVPVQQDIESFIIFTWIFIVFMIVKDQHYDNDIMKSKFPHMKFIEPSDKAA